MNARFFSLMIALVLAGCGGGNATSTAVPTAPVSGGPAAASFVIHIPNAAPAASSTVRRAQYVSSATQSISLAIAPASGCTGCSQSQTVTANLTSTSPNCQTGGAGTTCTLPFDILPGTYTFNVTTYSGPLASGTPTGNALSTDTGLPVTITAGQANAIGVTLNGIPASAQFSIGTPDPTRSVIGTTLFAGNPGALFAIHVSALDASGNLITGMGTTTLSTAVTPGTPPAGIAASAVPNSTTIGINVGSIANLNADTLTTTLHGTNCSLPGAVCTATLTLRFTQMIAVSDGNGVDVISPWGALVGRATTGISGQVGEAFDPEGHLLVANNTTNSVTVYNTPYSGAPSATVTGITNPLMIASSVDGEIFISSGTDVYELSIPYTAITGTFTGFTNITGIAADNVDSLYVSDAGTNMVSKFTLPYFPQAANLAYATALPRVGQLAVTSGHTAFVGNRGSFNFVQELSPAGALLGSTVSTGGNLMAGIIIDRNDNIAVLDQTLQGVDYATAPAFADTFVSLPNSSTPHGAVFDAFGNLYVSDGASRIYTFLAPSMTPGATIPSINNNSDVMAIWPRQ